MDNNGKKPENQFRITKIGFRVIVIVTAVMIVAVGLLCTSPSKAADDEPYVPPFIPEDETFDTETEPDITTDAYQTTGPDVTDTDPAKETTGTADTAEPPDTETDTETDTDRVTTAEQTTEAATTEKAPETKPADTSAGKQGYREYNGRQYGPNETFVGEYKTDRVQIGVSNVKDGKLNYYICDIKVKSVYDFHTAFANNSIGGVLYTSRIASSVGAGFAVNGDYCGFRYNGIIIREGKMYRNKKADGWDLCYLNRYGDLITCKNDAQDGKALADSGVFQSWCFGPTLVENYKALQSFNTPNLSSKDWAREPRTAIGQVDKLHYIFLVVDAIREPNGAGGWNTIGGMNFRELADTMASLGCKTAYNLDGGGSTTLWLNGKITNHPSGSGEREISDIIYFK